MTAKPDPHGLKPIDSSMLTHAAYDPAARTLTVRFKNGGRTYRYKDVTEERAAAFEGAASKGSYFLSQIKPHHAYEEILD